MKKQRNRETHSTQLQARQHKRERGDDIKLLEQ